MKESGFNHRWNYDDIFARSVIVGFMKLIDNVKIRFDYSDTKFELKRVPFIYGITGQERFLQDFLQNLPETECDVAKMEGSTDVLPRAHVTLTSDKIVSAALRNKFVRGTYVVEELDTNGNKLLRTYSSYINMIPMEFTFDVQIRGNTLNEIYKIKDQLISTFYKAKVFNTTYKGFRIPSQAGFPDDFTTEKMFEYTFPAGESWSTLKFTVLVESYFPVIDETTTLFRGNLMKAVDLNLNVSSMPIANESIIINNQDATLISNTPSLGTVSNKTTFPNLNEIPFLNLWLQGDLIEGTGGKLSFWKDNSLALNNINIYDETAQPTIVDPMLASIKGIVTDGINDTFEIPNINVVSEINGFFMIKTIDLDNRSHTLIANTQILEDRWQVGFLNGDIYFTVGIDTNSSTITYRGDFTNWTLVEFWFSNGILGLKVNNQLIGVTSVNKTTIGNISSKTNMFSNQGLLDFLKVEMVECLIWKKALTDKEHEFVIDYFSNKYQTF